MPYDRHQLGRMKPMNTKINHLQTGAKWILSIHSVASREQKGTLMNPGIRHDHVLAGYIGCNLEGIHSKSINRLTRKPAGVNPTHPLSNQQVTCPSGIHKDAHRKLRRVLRRWIREKNIARGVFFWRAHVCFFLCFLGESKAKPPVLGRFPTKSDPYGFLPEVNP